MEYKIQSCTRQCAATGRPLESGETFYSVLVAEGGQVVRYDYAAAHWPGPPEGAIGWWKSQMPSRTSRRPPPAPREVMLQLLDQFAEDPSRQDMRYILALLLVRRRVLRLEETQTDPAGQEVLVVHNAKTDRTLHIPAVIPSGERTRQIQDELAKLLEVE